jgi:hypothetical protein
MNELAKNDAVLADSVRSSAVEFLRVELRIANTMLDLAAATSEAESYARRRAQAQEAYSTAKRYLNEPAVPLHAEDVRVIAAGLRALEERITAAP